MSDKIMTLHPEGKNGVNISLAKYNQVKAAILDTLHEVGEPTFVGLTSTVENKLAGKFQGSIGWYVVTVKLDLEARRIIERIPGSSPQQLRLVK